MQFQKYKKSFSALQVENSFYRIVILSLLGLVCVLLFFVLTKKTIVTVQPWTLSRDAQVTENAGSQSYVEAWGLALAQLIGNVSPGNVDFVGEQLKPLLAPKIYHETLDAIQAGAQSLRDDRVTVRFEPLRVIYEKTTGMVFVYGNSFTRTGTGADREKKTQRTYEFKLEIANYLPQINYLNTYEGVPHTREQLDRLEKNERNADIRARKKSALPNYDSSPRDAQKTEEELPS